MRGFDKAGVPLLLALDLQRQVTTQGANAGLLGATDDGDLEGALIDEE